MLIRLPALCVCVGLAMAMTAPPTAPTTPPPTMAPLSAEDQAAKQRCRDNCNTDFCYLPDPDDCRMFTMCAELEQTAGGQHDYSSTRMQCAHGTMWAGGEQDIKITCDNPSNVQCNMCAGKPIGYKFQSSKKDCKTYWECGDNGPMAKCCGANEKFALIVDTQNYDCVPDNMNDCTNECPDKKHACQASSSGLTAPFTEDDNCRSYWDCADPNAPHPICCPENERYDHMSDGCVGDLNCNTKCDYEKNMCSGIQGHSLGEPYCRTYMKCGATRLDDKLWCCPPTESFSDTSFKCEPVPNEQIDTCPICPPGYSTDCSLRPVKGNSSMYEQYVGSTWMKRNCAPGTFFDGVTSCTCGTVDPMALDHACSLTFNITYDGTQNTSYIIRSGAESSTDIIPVGSGSVQPGESIAGRTSVEFDQSLFNEIPFLKQGMDKFYLKMHYYPKPASDLAKYVLLSNCESEGTTGSPSLEVFTQGGQLTLSFQTDKNKTSVVLLFKERVWNELRIIYTSTALYAFNAASGEKSRTFTTAPMTGTIVTPTKPMSIAGCSGVAGVDGFIGSISKVEISKCLKQDWVDDFNAEMLRKDVISIQ